MALLDFGHNEILIFCHFQNAKKKNRSEWEMITQAGGDATNIWQKQLVRFKKNLIIKWDVSDSNGGRLSMLHRTEFGQNDHREDSSFFN